MVAKKYFTLEEKREAKNAARRKPPRVRLSKEEKRVAANVARRERYATDSEYRARVNAANLERYHTNPEYRARVNAQNSARARAAYVPSTRVVQTPEERSAKARARGKRPPTRAERDATNERRRLLNATPEGQARIAAQYAKKCAKLKAAGLKHTLSDAQKAKVAAAYATPEGKAKRKRICRESLLKAKASGKPYASRSAMSPEKRERHRATNRAYRKTPAGKAACAAQCAKRLASGWVNKDIVMRVLSARVCHYCGVGIAPMIGVKIHECKATLDHKIPISRGGRTEESNLVAACWTCNSRKHEKTDVEFLRNVTTLKRAA